jgi:hypothetical protein
MSILQGYEVTKIGRQIKVPAEMVVKCHWKSENEELVGKVIRVY